MILLKPITTRQFSNRSMTFLWKDSFVPAPHLSFADGIEIDKEKDDPHLTSTSQRRVSGLGTLRSHLCFVQIMWLMWRSLEQLRVK